MKTHFSFIDPGAIMGVVIALIVLAVGSFAFLVTLGQFTPSASTIGLGNPSSGTWATAYYSGNQSYAWQNLTKIQTDYIATNVNQTGSTSTQVFNIIGVVLIIGAIMSIVGLVYNYVR